MALRTVCRFAFPHTHLGWNCESDLERDLKRLRNSVNQLREALDATGVALVARGQDESHSWVTHGDSPSFIVWCQYCGVHRIELPVNEITGPCRALSAIKRYLEAT